MHMRVSHTLQAYTNTHHTCAHMHRHTPHTPAHTTHVCTHMHTHIGTHRTCTHRTHQHTPHVHMHTCTGTYYTHTCTCAQAHTTRAHTVHTSTQNTHAHAHISHTHYNVCTHETTHNITCTHMFTCVHIPHRCTHINTPTHRHAQLPCFSYRLPVRGTHPSPRVVGGRPMLWSASQTRPACPRPSGSPPGSQGRGPPARRRPPAQEVRGGGRGRVKSASERAGDVPG